MPTAGSTLMVAMRLRRMGACRALTAVVDRLPGRLARTVIRFAVAFVRVDVKVGAGGTWWPFARLQFNDGYVEVVRCR